MAVVGSLTLRSVHRRTFPGGRCPPPTKVTEYINADRKRVEFRGHAGYGIGRGGREIYRPNPRTALLHRYDLRQTFLVNFDDREYAAWPLQPFTTPDEWRTHAVPVAESRTVPTVLVETETVDTGERRELFGRPARHVMTTRRVIRLTEPQSKGNDTVTDGWYIDLDTSVSGEPPWWSSRSGHAFLTICKDGEQPDMPTFKDIGEPERGYALISRTRTNGSLDELEVTQLSTVAIDPSLFDVPPDYRLVEQIRQQPTLPLVVRLHLAYERLKRSLSS